VTDQTTAARFLDLHHGATPLLMPNPWDAGAAKLLASLGFQALATTSSGFAATLGRGDGGVTRDEALAHAAAVAAAVDVPVSADLEDCFAAEPEGVADTVERAIATGVAGGSVEDFTRDRANPIYELEHAVARVEAAAEVAHAGGLRYVLTARAEAALYGEQDLGTIIDRLQRFSAAGADVLFAPGVVAADDVRRLVAEVDKPVNVLALPTGPDLAGLTEAGVARVSVGGALAWVAMSAVVEAGRELLDQGTFGYFDRMAAGRKAWGAVIGR
jgi:2-methylisocitrate lyase-like PEP mutase family enzyme